MQGMARRYSYTASRSLSLHLPNTGHGITCSSGEIVGWRFLRSRPVLRVSLNLSSVRPAGRPSAFGVRFREVTNGEAGGGGNGMPPPRKPATLICSGWPRNGSPPAAYGGFVWQSLHPLVLTM